MIFPGELVVKGALDAGLSLLQGNTAFYTSDIFSLFTSDEQTAIQAWLSAVTISPMTALPQTNLQMPLVVVQLESQEEIRDSQWISSQGVMILGSQSQGTDAQNILATPFRSVYAVHIQTPNQRELLWLQMILKWCLLMEREWMETQMGLMNAQISASGLLPLDESTTRDTPTQYERVLVVTGDHVDSYQYSPSSTYVTSTSVSLTPQSFTFGG